LHDCHAVWRNIINEKCKQLIVVDVILDGFRSFLKLVKLHNDVAKATIGIATATALQLGRFEHCMVAMQFVGEDDHTRQQKDLGTTQTRTLNTKRI
jgi:hypothetical protein